MNDKNDNITNNLRRLPAVGTLLDQPMVRASTRLHGLEIVTSAVRSVVERVRSRCIAEVTEVPPIDELAAAICEEADALCVAELPQAINATGVILHTGLGRARLAPAAAEAVYRTALGHSLVEFDIETGKRGNRQHHVVDLLRALTSAEEALVVNNCAAAVFLAVSAVASGREVIISRGQMVEIGGGFRLPEIIEAAGARLREVGTTNKTRVGDYASAITSDTAMILRCHPSNFAMTGFVEETDIRELAALGTKRGVVVLDDQGSGNLHPAPWADSSVRSSIVAGAGLVTFSGDKLLGGPQCGVIAGHSVLVHQAARHPLARAMRIDKLSLAGLRATLQLHLRSDCGEGVPTIKYMNRDSVELKKMATTLGGLIRRRVTAQLATVSVRDSISEVGGGSMPHKQMPTWCVVVQPNTCNVEQLAVALRRNKPAIIARIRDRALWLDPRSMNRDEFTLTADAVRIALGGSQLAG